MSNDKSNVKVTVETALIENFAPEMAISTKKHTLKAAYGREKRPLVFACGSDDVLRVFINDESQQTRWSQFELTKEGEKVTAFDVIQDSDSDSVSIAVAYKQNNNISQFYLVREVNPQDLNSDIFKDKPYAFPDTSATINKIYLDKKEVLFASCQNDEDANYYRFVDGKVTKYSLPEHGIEVKDLSLGTYKKRKGVFLLYNTRSSQTLSFHSFPLSEGGNTIAERFDCGKDVMNAIAVLPNKESDILFAGGDSLYSFRWRPGQSSPLQKKIIDASSGRKILQIKAAQDSKVQSLIIDYEAPSQIRYLAELSRKRDDENAEWPSDWYTPEIIGTKVSNFAPLSSSISVFDRDLFYISQTEQLIHSRRDTTSNFRTEHSVPIKAVDKLRNFYSFNAIAKFEMPDSSNWDEQKVKLTASRAVNVTINGINYLIGENKSVEIELDSDNKLDIIQETDNILSTLLYVKANFLESEVVIDLAEPLCKKLRTLETAYDFWNAIAIGEILKRNPNLDEPSLNNLANTLQKVLDFREILVKKVKLSGSKLPTEKVTESKSSLDIKTSDASLALIGIGISGLKGLGAGITTTAGTIAESAVVVEMTKIGGSAAAAAETAATTGAAVAAETAATTGAAVAAETAATTGAAVAAETAATTGAAVAAGTVLATAAIVCVILIVVIALVLLASQENSKKPQAYVEVSLERNGDKAFLEIKVGESYHRYPLQTPDEVMGVIQIILFQIGITCNSIQNWVSESEPKNMGNSHSSEKAPNPKKESSEDESEESEEEDEKTELSPHNTQPYTATTEKEENKDCQISITMHLDEDRDGEVDEKLADVQQWEWGKGGKGAIIAVPCKINNGWNRQPLKFIYKKEGNNCSDEWTATLSVTTKTEINIYSNCDDNAQSLLENNCIEIHKKPELKQKLEEGNLTLWMEAKTFPNKEDEQLWYVNLSFSFSTPKTQPKTQKAIIRIAPWIMAHDLIPTAVVEIYERKNKKDIYNIYKEVRAFLNDYNNKIENSHVCCLFTNTSDVGSRIFYRDEYRAGYISTPNFTSINRLGKLRSCPSFQDVQFTQKQENLHEENLHEVNRKLLKEYNSSLSTISGNENSLNFGGNYLVSPPLENYPLGRIVIGSGIEKEKNDLIEFLRSQKIQAPIVVDTTWLQVKHIDEIISFVPNLKPVGEEWQYKVLIASPKLGYVFSLMTCDHQNYENLEITRILQEANEMCRTMKPCDIITESQSIFEKRRNLEEIKPAQKSRGDYESNPEPMIEFLGKTVFWGTSDFIGTKCKLDPINYTVVDPLFRLAEDRYAEDFVNVQKKIDTIYETLKEKLKIKEENFIQIPVIFGSLTFPIRDVEAITFNSVNNAKAITPNSVNMLVINNEGCSCLVPKPFGPVVKDSSDCFYYLFEADIKQKLKSLGLDVQFVNNWDGYHKNDGQIHCGTNQFPYLPGKDQLKWWEMKQPE